MFTYPKTAMTYNNGREVQDRIRQMLLSDDPCMIARFGSVELQAVVDYLKENGVVNKDIQPTREAITTVLSEIEEDRPDDISWMLGEFEVVDD